MKKIALIVGALTMLIVSVSIIKYLKKPTNSAAYTIGILQTASHPSLDAARDGFIAGLKSKMGDKVEFVIRNAEGSISQAHAIAQQFHANKQLSGFLAIATPAAQALHAVEKERPIFIAAVTDPDALGLISPTTNVSGTHDMSDIKAEVAMLMQLIPSAKTVGLIYTAGETNSIAQIAKMRQELEARGLSAVDFGIGNESDVQAIVELACRKVDVILAPTDNTIASAMAAIAMIALKYKKPLIASFNAAAQDGALAAQGVDYGESGNQTARIAYEVLVDGKKPYELPIEQVHGSQIFINQNTLATLGLSIPESLKEQIVFVS